MIYLLFFLLSFNLYSFELLDLAPSFLKPETQLQIEDLITSSQIKVEEMRKVFSKSLEKNFREDSLKVLDNNQKLFSYPSDRNKLKGKLAKKVFFTLDFLSEKSINAKRLINDLMSSHHQVIISPNLKLRGSYVSYYKDRCGFAHFGIFVFHETKKVFNGLEEKCKFGQIGASSKVNWKPLSGFRSKSMNAINLVHELYHSYDMIRGVLDHRIIKHPKLESSEVREYRAVYFENLVRKDLKQKVRTKYSKNSKQDLFLNGKQVWL